jgi:hypothetical protein
MGAYAPMQAQSINALPPHVRGFCTWGGWGDVGLHVCGPRSLRAAHVRFGSLSILVTQSVSGVRGVECL